MTGDRKRVEPSSRSAVSDSVSAYCGIASATSATVISVPEIVTLRNANRAAAAMRGALG